MIRKRVATALVASTFSLPALAADPGWYGFASVGQSHIPIDTASDAADLQALGVTFVGVTAEENSTGYKFGAGYMFSKNLGVEGGWVDLGTGKESASGTFGGSPFLTTAEFKASGPFVAGVVAFPFSDQFSGFAKLGFIDATVKTTASGSLTGSASTTDWKTMYGAGVQYDFSERWGVRAEYEMFQKLGDDSTTGTADVSLLSIGAVFRFK